MDRTTATDLAYLRELYDLGQDSASTLIGVHSQTVSKIERGVLTGSRPVQRLIAELSQRARVLDAENGAYPWWFAPRVQRALQGGSQLAALMAACGFVDLLGPDGTLVPPAKIPR